MCFVTVVFVFVLFFFLVRDPFILAHAIGALLYLCIHWSVQHKKIKNKKKRCYCTFKHRLHSGLESLECRNCSTPCSFADCCEQPGNEAKVVHVQTAVTSYVTRRKGLSITQNHPLVLCRTHFGQYHAGLTMDCFLMGTAVSCMHASIGQSGGWLCLSKL